MNVTELKKDTIQYQAKITIPAAEIESLIEKELVTIAKTAKADGFRVGKVPRAILKKKYASSVRMDVVKTQINSSIDETIKKNNLNVVLEPVIDDLTNEDGKDLEFTLKVDLLPEIILPDFKKISIEQAKLEVSSKDIDDEMNKLSSFSKSYDIESQTKAKSGDQVTMDAIGYVDGVAFDGGKLESYKLVLGSNTFIPGFEDQLIGCKKGDDISVKVSFPKEYHAENLAGKPSEFKVQVLAVHKEQAATIDDEFAKKFKCDTVKQLKEQISKNIESSYAEAIYTSMKMKLFDQLETMLKFDVPESLLKREMDILKDQSDQMVEDSLSIKDKPAKEQEKYFAALASRRVKIGLMLAEYVKQKGVQIKEEDIRQAIIAQALNYPGQEQKVFEFYQKNREALESLKGPVLEEKAVNEIFAKEIIIKEKTYSKDKLEQLLEKESRD